MTLLEETISARFEAGASERAATAARARHQLERLGAARQRLLDLLTDGVLDPAELIVAKHRNGPTGTVHVKQRLDVVRFDP